MKAKPGFIHLKCLGVKSRQSSVEKPSSEALGYSSVRGSSCRGLFEQKAQVLKQMESELRSRERSALAANTVKAKLKTMEERLRVKKS